MRSARDASGRFVVHTSAPARRASFFVNQGVFSTLEYRLQTPNSKRVRERSAQRRDIGSRIGALRRTAEMMPDTIGRRAEAQQRSRRGSSSRRVQSGRLTIPDRRPTASGDSDHGRELMRPTRSRRHLTVQPSVAAVEVRLYGRPGLRNCDLSHIAGFEPVLSSQHQNVMHASLQASTLRILGQ